MSDNNPKAAIAAYRAKLVAACCALDVDALTGLLREQGDRGGIRPLSVEISMHKVRLQLPEMTDFERTVSRQWLLERGYSLDIAGGGDAG